MFIFRILYANGDVLDTLIMTTTIYWHIEYMCELTASRYVSPVRVDEVPAVFSERFHVLTSKFLRQFGILLVNIHINKVSIVNKYTDRVNSGAYQRTVLVAGNANLSCNLRSCTASTLHHLVDSLITTA